MSTKLSAGRVRSTYQFIKRPIETTTPCRRCVASSASPRAATTSGSRNQSRTGRKRMLGCSGLIRASFTGARSACSGARRWADDRGRRRITSTILNALTNRCQKMFRTQEPPGR